MCGIIKKQKGRIYVEKLDNGYYKFDMVKYCTTSYKYSRTLVIPAHEINYFEFIGDYKLVTLHGAKPRGFCLVIQTFFFLLH
jgi:hypothetical protein